MDDTLLDLGGVKISPTLFLIGFFGAMLACLWYISIAFPASASKTSVWLLIALTSIYAIALTSQLRRCMRAFWLGVPHATLQ